MRTLLIIGIVVLGSCNSMPKDMCGCLDQALYLSKQQEQATGSRKESLEKKMEKLGNHCRHLRWRGSDCSTEEMGLIFNKHGTISFWECGEAIMMVMHRPYPADADTFNHFLKRWYDQNGNKQFPRMYNTDTIRNRPDIEDTLSFPEWYKREVEGR